MNEIVDILNWFLKNDFPPKRVLAAGHLCVEPFVPSAIVDHPLLELRHGAACLQGLLVAVVIDDVVGVLLPRSSRLVPNPLRSEPRHLEARELG